MANEVRRLNATQRHMQSSLNLITRLYWKVISWRNSKQALWITWHMERVSCLLSGLERWRSDLSFLFRVWSNGSRSRFWCHIKGWYSCSMWERNQNDCFELKSALQRVSFDTSYTFFQQLQLVEVITFGARGDGVVNERDTGGWKEQGKENGRYTPPRK